METTSKDSNDLREGMGAAGSSGEADSPLRDGSSAAAGSDGLPQPTEGAPVPEPAGPVPAGLAGLSSDSTAAEAVLAALAQPVETSPPATASPVPSPPVPVATPPAQPARASEPVAEETPDADSAQRGDGTAATQSVAPLLAKIVELGGSDLHLKPMRPPLVRLHGRLVEMEGFESLDPESLEAMLLEILGERQRQALEENLQVDFGYSVPGLSRFRATVFYQRSTLAAVFRCIPFKFPSIEDWGLPPILKDLAQLQRGLILVTGPTGAGKSSTLAAMIREIADTKAGHIVSIEDPIEFLIRDSNSAVTQREVGTDCLSFQMGLRNALRQDPDVIMVGEMRDRETVRTVLTAAETGHLVLSTLHTNSAAQTLDRIMDLFPGAGQAQIRMQLAHSLEAIVSLQLIPTTDGEGLTAAVEIMRASDRIRKLLEEGAVSDITKEIEDSVVLHGMQSMNQSLVSLVLTGRVRREVAEAHSHNRGDFDLLLRKHIPADQEGNDDMFSYCDYSNIAELDELKKLRTDAEERQVAVEKEKNEIVASMRQELEERLEEVQKLRATLARGKEEYEKLHKQASMLKTDYEGRINKLQERVRQLTRQVAKK